jgi:hypothetical protein
LKKLDDDNYTYQSVGNWVNFTSNDISNGLSRMRNAPNGSIIIESKYPSEFLHVIHQPNKEGKSCNFEQQGIELPYPQGYTLNYFPNFNTYDLPQSPCDTLGIDNPNKEIWEIGDDILIFPNPANEQLNIYIPWGKEGLLRVFTASGQLIFETSLIEEEKTYNFDISNWFSGVYYINITGKSSNITKRILKISK